MVSYQVSALKGRLPQIAPLSWGCAQPAQHSPDAGVPSDKGAAGLRRAQVVPQEIGDARFGGATVPHREEGFHPGGLDSTVHKPLRKASVPDKTVAWAWRRAASRVPM